MADAVGPIGVLHELKELGVRLSLDDFGTGYSSMAYLKHLAVDALKIDRSFVRDMADSHEDAAIVRSIVALAHALDLEVVAEGVATQRAWFAVRDAGCDVAQGFHLGRPMAAEGFTTWLDAQGAESPQSGCASSVVLQPARDAHGGDHRPVVAALHLVGVERRTRDARVGEHVVDRDDRREPAVGRPRHRPAPCRSRRAASS